MRNTLSLFVVVLALAVTAGACGGKGNPFEPDGSGEDGGIQPPPGAIVHSVPVPGSSKPFRWWIESLDPPKNSQLNVGQKFKATVRCDGPSGYSYALREEFSNGQGTEPIRMTSSQGSGTVSGCSRGIGPALGINSTLSSTGYPDLPYYRFSVWIEAGESIISPSRPPDLVIDEWIGWTINRG